MGKAHYIIIASLILFSIISVYFCIPPEKAFIGGQDENSYLKLSTLIAEKGIFKYKDIVKSYVSDEGSYLYPSPSRIGYIMMASGWLRLFGFNFSTLAKFSFFCYVLVLFVCFYFSKKFFGRDIAFLLILLLSSSPLMMAMAKRALQDTAVDLFCLLSIWTFMDFLMENKKTKFWLFLLVYSFTITVKESAVLLMVFFVLFAMVHKYYYKKEIPAYYLLRIIFVPLAVVAVFYLALCGPATFANLIKNRFDTYFVSCNLSGYAVSFCTGPWYKFFIDYLLLSPVSTFLFIGYIGYILTTRNPEWKITYLLGHFVSSYALINLIRYGKIIRFIGYLDVVFYLFSILMLYELFRYLGRDGQIRWVFISTLAIFFINYQNFVYLFCQFNIYDPISVLLLSARRIITY